MKKAILFSAGFIFAILPPAPAQTITPSGDLIVYVNAASSGNGSSWADATPSLADALKWANLNKASWTEAGPLRIFVAKGIYKPQYSPEDGVNFGTNRGRDNAFLLVPNVQLYGGFDPVNGKVGLDDERIFFSGGSILSGDLSGNDTEGNLENNREDNAYHVAVSAGSVGTGLLDGFTITGGNTFVTADPYSSIKVNELFLYRTEGGGMYNMESSPTLTNVSITGNKAFRGGGGMVNYSSSPTLTHVIIAGNTSIYAGGGICNLYSSSPTLTNVMISGNAVTSQNIGGGIYNAGSSPTLTNVTITGNRASAAGAGIYNSSSSPSIRNSIIWGNTNGIANVSSSSPVISYSLVQGLTDTDNGNISSAGIPVDGSTIFTGPGLYTNAPTTAGNYTLAIGSPAVNQGNNSYFDADETPDLAHITTDLAGNLRIRGGRIDLGAYESGGTLPVILVAFTVALQENRTLLTWRTTGEFNASHFEIQRSTDARTFKAIGQVEAKGAARGDTDQGTESYFFNDHLSDSGNLSIADRRPAVLYYRLRMADLDGTFAYSDIATIGVEGIRNTLPARLYPNPVRGDVVMLETGWGMTRPEIKVFDLLGREVGAFIRVMADKAELNVGFVSPGMYLVRVRDQGGPVTILKFLKE